MKNIQDKMNINEYKSEKVFKLPFHFLKWIFTVELIILIIFFIIGIIFYEVSDKTKFTIKYNIEKIFLENVRNKNENYKDIKQAIEENSYIKLEDKEFISMVLEKEIEENLEFIDANKIIKRLEKLKIDYHHPYILNKENNTYEFKNAYASSIKNIGKYDALLNRMDLYQNEANSVINVNNDEQSIEFFSSNKEVYFHELNHLLTKNTLSTAMNTFANNLEKKENLQNNFLEDIYNSIQRVHKNIFLETINELFTREYFDEYCRQNNYIKQYEAYEQEMVYAYGLAEILSEDTIKKYKFNDNQSILISGLLEIDNNIGEVYKLISSINSVSLYENKDEKLKKENYKRIHDGYAYFYEKKYQKKMYDDLEMLLHFYGTPIQTEEERKKIRNFLEMESYDEIINIIPKGYVSKEYKKNHPNVQVEYTKEGELQFKSI